ncbi:MAG: hypothetical protein KGI83_00360 [Verrucomicrobiota bacterium]|nr:hypothetical protein [Verrucomicrobiota bacterium]
MNSKVGFWLRRTSASLGPPAPHPKDDASLGAPSLNLFKLSCFGAASLPQTCGAGFAENQLLSSFVYMTTAPKKFTCRLFEHCV